jgi:hypothetical protein
MVYTAAAAAVLVMRMAVVHVYISSCIPRALVLSAACQKPLQRLANNTTAKARREIL